MRVLYKQRANHKSYHCLNNYFDRLLTIKSINMARTELKMLLKSIVMNDSLTDQNYYDTIINALHEHLNVRNKPIVSLTKNPIFQPGDVVLVPTYGTNRNHYAVLIDLMLSKNIAVIRYITHNNDLHPGMMVPVESRFLEGYFVPYNVMIPLTSIERCCFPYDNLKQFKQLKK